MRWCIGAALLGSSDFEGSLRFSSAAKSCPDPMPTLHVLYSNDNGVNGCILAVVLQLGKKPECRLCLYSDETMQGSVDLSKYTLDNYMRIVTYKTAYYSFYLPVACGMVLAGIEDEVRSDIELEHAQVLQL